MNLHTIWSLATLEMRSCRRLVRYWVFIGVALFLCGTIYYWNFSNVSYWPSSPSDWFPGSIDAQYIFNDMIEVFGNIFIIGVVVLSFDIQYRDVRARVNEVIDAKPPNNLALVVGRILGTLILILIPILLFTLIASCYEAVAQLFHIANRFGMYPISAVPRLLWSIVPSLLLFSSFVTCFAMFVRIRLLVAITAIGLLVIYGFFFFLLPQGLKEVFSLFPGSFQFHSDLAPTYSSAPILVNQLAIVLVALAFIVYASALIRRTQPNRVIFAATGSMCLTLGVLCIVGLYSTYFDSETRKDEWVKVLSEQQIKALPDIQHVEGTVELFPGRTLNLDLSLTIVPPVENPTDSVIFSLNPGYRIRQLFVDGEEISSHDFSHGLLKISKSELPDVKHQIRVVARGRPNQHFAYLDQARDYGKQSIPWVNSLGTKSYIFHSNFVALVPAVKWYPTSGAVWNENLLERRPRDLFTMDINVSVPKKWLVAMVGDREVVNIENRATFRFKSETPVPEMALIAANFDARNATIEGINFELLLSKKHQRNLYALAPYFSQLEDWVAENINKAQELSLVYPYEKFYVIEVPSTLRIFGGGWRMDTVLQPPGMMLMRETTFPTAKYDYALRFNSVDESSENQIVLDQLVNFFADDVQGGNPFIGFSRNFVNNQISPSGRGSTVLEYLVEQLAAKVITRRHSLFFPSTWEYAKTTFSPKGFPDAKTADGRATTIAMLPSTWQELEGSSLFDLAFSARPIPSFRALMTKVDALVHMMVEQFGAIEIARFLRQLNSNFSGKSFTLEDFYQTAAASGIDLHEWVAAWLEGTTLPGYVIANPQISKLSSSVSDKYQTTFVIHNAETVPGFVRLLWSENPRVNFSRHSADIRASEPIYLAGLQSVQVSIQSDEPLGGVEIDPYLALNRTPFSVPLPRQDDEFISYDSEQQFLKVIEWIPPVSSSVIVDDLDPGFSIQGQIFEKGSAFNNPFSLVVPIVEIEMDIGLPIAHSGSLPADGWTRHYDFASFGRYRRTHARAVNGTRETSARFVAKLPQNGEWKLDYHVPEAAFFMNRRTGEIRMVLGVRRPSYYREEGLSVPDKPEERYNLIIKDSYTEWTEELDITQASVGWNGVGTFRLGSTEVEVLVSDFAGHENIDVFADAIRWTPVEAK